MENIYILPSKLTYALNYEKEIIFGEGLILVAFWTGRIHLRKTDLFKILPDDTPVVAMKLLSNEKSKK
jgi:hypothetical protein